MSFLNETWFWTGFFGVTGSLGGILIKEFLSSRTQLKVERLRLYEQESIDAYKKLYDFVSHAGDILFPSEEPRQDFISIMKHSYLNDVNPLLLFFTPEIREILYELESQYEAIRNPDMIPKVSFNIFIDKYIFKYLERLRKIIEKHTDDDIFH